MVQRAENSIRITWGWPWELGIPFAVIGILLGGACVAIGRSPLANGTPRSAADIAFIFVVFGGCGLSMFLAGLALMLNRSTIVADKERLTYSARPIFLRGPRTFGANGVLQFFVPIRLAADQSSGSSKSGTGLYVILSDGTAHLITATFRSKIALYQVQRELQEFYGLEDLPVYGQTALPVSKR